MPERSKVFNFSAGPAVMPEAVLERARTEMLNWNDSGMSVMELSHRSKNFDSIIKSAEKNLRILANVPDNYKVLFVQGGGLMQFSAIPLNLSKPGRNAEYIVTGAWSKQAFDEGSRFCGAHLAADMAPQQYRRLPTAEEYSYLADTTNTDYIYYCDNETIHGVEFQAPPVVPSSIPLISDASSNFLSREARIRDHGLVFATAQKNFGPSGLVAVIVRDDLLGKAQSTCPYLMDYKVMADGKSLVNTPPTYSIYMANLVFEWMLQQGGVPAFEARAAHRSQRIYDVIDSSPIYKSYVDKSCRSRMNIPFRAGPGGVGDSALEELFLTEAEKSGLEQLRGHRSVGGIRASVYNAMPDEGVDALIDFMRAFEEKHSS